MRFQHLLVVVLLLLASCNSQSKEEMLQSGIELLEAGNARGSIVYLKNALEKDPNFYQARYHLADAYLKSGRFERAENELQKVALQSTSFTDLPIKLAEVYLLTSRADIAVKTLDKYHLDNEPTSKSLDIQGRAYALVNNFEKAESLFRDAIILETEDPYPKLHLIKLLLQQSRDEEAYKRLQLTLKQHPKLLPAYDLLATLELKRKQHSLALDLYRQLYELEPTNVKALYMLGFIPYMTGQLTEAEKAHKQLVKDFPKDFRTSQLGGLIAYQKGAYDDALIDLLNSLKYNEQPLTFYFLGMSYFKLMDLELSISQFQKTLDRQPELTQARLMLAIIFLKQSRLDDCLRQVHHVLANEEQNGMAYNLLGSVQLLQKKYDDALQSFARAIEIDPSAADVYLKKGRSHISMGENDLAEKALHEALSLSPENLGARLLLATLYVRQENFVSALDNLQTGLSGSPSDALIYSLLAKIYFKLKDDPSAELNLQKAKLADPEYLSPVFSLASHYLTKGQYVDAIDEYLEVLERDRGNINALLGLGLAYELSGQVDLAQGVYQKLLKIEGPEAAFFVAQQHSISKRPDKALSVIEKALVANPTDRPLHELKVSILLKNGHKEEALLTLERLEEKFPGHGYPRIIGILLNNGQLDRADELANKVIKHMPRSSYGYLLLAAILEFKKQYGQAEQIVKRGLTVSEENSALQLRLGHVLELQGSLTAATELYQSLLEAKPTYYPAAFALGSMNDRFGNKSEAQRYYQKTLSLNDRHIPALNNLAYLYADNYGDINAALRLSLQAYRLAPAQQDVVDTLGFVLLKSGKLDEAAKVLKKAYRLDPENPTVSYHLALAYVELRQIDKAIAELEKTLETDNFPEVESCRKLLAKLKT